MKIKNLKPRDLVYMKKIEDIKKSKYVKKVESNGNIYFENTGAFFSNSVDGEYSGTVVVIESVYTESVTYRTNNPNRRGWLSRHAFRKPTKQELRKYEVNKE